MSEDVLLAREEALRLYDKYGPLLTEREEALFRYYYSYDLSLGEIAENEKISRAAVSDSLNKSLTKLREYEDKLHLVAKGEKSERLLATLEKGTAEEKGKALKELSELLNHGI
jgi:predicted DNA-binding protein YlxM (UPF0122 family)